MNLPQSVTLDNALAVRNEGVAACKAKALQQQGSSWVIDASALQQFDSALLSTLLEWQRAAKAQGLSLSLQGMSTGVATRLRALAGSYGMSEVLPITAITA
jgi:phospholipid transport system transporter-binding protein